MFDLVNDIDSYPQFLPWCRHAEIDEVGQDWVLATIHIAKAGVHQSFTTRNRLVRPERIELELVKGPFSHLYGVWRFQPLSAQACKVSFELEFLFSNLVLEKVVGPVFNHIVNTLLDAFVKQADARYAQS